MYKGISDLYDTTDVKKVNEVKLIPVTGWSLRSLVGGTSSRRAAELILREF